MQIKFYKTLICCLVLGPLFFCLLLFPNHAEGVFNTPGGEKKLRVFLNGANLHFDRPPIVRGADCYLPLRFMAEQAGFQVNWDPGLKRVSLRGAGREVSLYPENPLYAVDDTLYRTSQPPLLQNGRTYVGFDLLEHGAGFVLQDGDLQRGYLHFTYKQQRDEASDSHETKRVQPVYFVELLLPAGDKVEPGGWFNMRLAAPHVRGIYAYEINFNYNPEIIQVIDMRNPTYNYRREFNIREIDNKVGRARYTLTALGYRDDLPPRSTLAVIEAVVYKEGVVPLDKSTLMITALDNSGRSMPVGLEERILTVGPASAKP